MTEQEYIDATNLQKIRIARQLLRDCLPRKSQQAFWHDAGRALYAWEEELTPLVKTRGEAKDIA